MTAHRMPPAGAVADALAVPDDEGGELVRRCAENALAVYYCVRLTPRGKSVMVRVGIHKRFACLECRTADVCEHAQLAIKFAAAETPPGDDIT